MAPDERDRMFDKALARHLRSCVPLGDSLRASDLFAPQSSECADPETLAAYHERSLLPEQMNSLKEHIVGCANCQTVLAHLEMTDEIPLQSVEEERVFAQTAPAPAAAVSNQVSAPLPQARARKSRRLLLLRGARWQWLVPTGALAAGLLVWIALHENPRMQLPSPNESEGKMAKNEAPAPIPSGSAPLPQPSAPAKPAPTLTRPEAASSDSALANGRVPSRAARQSTALGGAAGARSADSKADKELREGKDRERDTSTDQLMAANRADLDTRTAAESLRKKEDVPSQAAKAQAEAVELNAQTQNQNNNYLSQKIPGPAPLGQMQAPAKAKSARAAASAAPSGAPPPPPAEVNGIVSGYADTGSLVVAHSISGSRLFSSPGSNATWRVGRDGLIEFSKDGGSSWSRQTSGVTADLLTGFAPSDQVCWIVGRAGAVLLTIDGGIHWRVLPSPPVEDLGGVLASDALHATIWNARRTKSFATSDGGLTWRPAPNP